MTDSFKARNNINQIPSNGCDTNKVRRFRLFVK